MFGEVIKTLKSKQFISSKSSLFVLNPFLQGGILRIGGRITNAHLPFNRKYQTLLPNKHRFTELIVQREHLRTFHGGPQVVLNAVRLQFWPIAGMSVVRRVIHSCVLCKRVHPPKSVNPLMGDLPKGRVTPSRPFSESGIDYAGPFSVKELTRSGRRGSPAKAYLAIFVCFATKAIHIEVVSSLSTEAFINALKRFISRRGYCKCLHSDNGTNFKGAQNEINEWYKLSSSKSHNVAIEKFCSNHLIQWKFIPARSPHFGGLWEAAVKSVKMHLAKITYLLNFTFEELTTITAQIEAILNSRPLTPQSCNPNDLDVLTPAHFLVGESLLALPEPDVQSIKLNRLSRFQLLQQIQQQFWKQWSQDYLNSLQVRSRKFHGSQNSSIQLGSLVLLKEETPPLTWRRGRVIDVHPGKDGIVRVVTIKTSSATVKRAVTQITELLHDNVTSALPP